MTLPDKPTIKNPDDFIKGAMADKPAKKVAAKTKPTKKVAAKTKPAKKVAAKTKPTKKVAAKTKPAKKVAAKTKIAKKVAQKKNIAVAVAEETKKMSVILSKKQYHMWKKYEFEEMLKDNKVSFQKTITCLLEGLLKKYDRPPKR